MNVLFEFKSGKVITPFSFRSILPGITRKSVIALMEEWGVEIEERPITVKEVMDGLRDGEIVDAFGVGTAAVVSHIRSIAHNGEDLNCLQWPTVNYQTACPTLSTDYNVVVKKTTLTG